MTDISKVVVIDPQPLFRHGVAHALASTRAFSVVGEGATADDAVSLVTQHSPGLAVMDVNPGDGGLRSVEQVAAASPETAIILITNADNRDFVEKAFHCGVSGYLLKNIEVSELCQASSIVAAGDIYICRKLVSCLFKAAAPQPMQMAKVKFSDREEQILQLLSRGMSNKNIAFELVISEKTAKYYLTSIMKKLNARNRVEVAVFAAGRKP